MTLLDMSKLIQNVRPYVDETYQIQIDETINEVVECATKIAETLSWMIKDIDWRNHCDMVPIREKTMSDDKPDPGEKEDSEQMKIAREVLKQLEGAE